MADEICITNVPTISKFFETEDDALEYAIHNQRDRRSLTDGEIAGCLAVLDSRKQRGGDVKSEDYKKSKAQPCAIDNDTPEPVIVRANASARKVIN